MTAIPASLSLEPGWCRRAPGEVDGRRALSKMLDFLVAASGRGELGGLC